MRFPAEQLRPSGGFISARIFKNERAEVPEALFWSVEVEFEPVDFVEDAMRTSLAADWIRLPIKDWRDLAGLVVGGPGAHAARVRRLDERTSAKTFEASFYVLEHDMADRCRITFGQRTGAAFQVQVDMDVELIGYGADDADGRPDSQLVNINASVLLPFNGVRIDGAVVPGGAEHLDEAVAALSRYLNPAGFQPPAVDAHSFHFAPALVP